MEIEKARKLQKVGKLQEALEILSFVLQTNPNDAIANYEFGSILDLSDRSEEAIPFYKKALESGLPEELEKECLLGLGSSLCWRQQYKESLRVLKRGIEKYPENFSLRLFYGIALHKAGEFSRSSKIFLEILSESNDEEIIKFKRAIKNYLVEM